MFRVGYQLMEDSFVPVRESSYAIQSRVEWMGDCVKWMEDYIKIDSNDIKEQTKLFFIALPRLLIKWTGTSSYLLSEEDSSRFTSIDRLTHMSTYEQYIALHDLEEQSRLYCSSVSFFDQINCIRGVVKACNIYEVSMMEAGKNFNQEWLKLQRGVESLKKHKCDVYAPVILEKGETSFSCGYSQKEYRENLLYCQDKSLVKNTCTINPLWPFLSINKQPIAKREPVHISFSKAVDYKKTLCMSRYLSLNSLVKHINSINHNYNLRTYISHQDIASSFYNSPELKGDIKKDTDTLLKFIKKDDYGFAAAWAHVNEKDTGVSFMSENTRRSDYCYGLGTVSRPVPSITSLAAVPEVLEDYRQHISNEFVDGGAFIFCLANIVSATAVICLACCVGFVGKRIGRLTLPSWRTGARAIERSSSYDSFDDPAFSSDIISDDSFDDPDFSSDIISEPTTVSNSISEAVVLRDRSRRNEVSFVAP